MSDDFGLKLKKYRASSGLTQAQLSEKSGVSRKQISDFEMNLQKNPKAQTIKKLSEALNVPVEVLLGEVDSSDEDLLKTTQEDSFNLRLKYFRVKQGLNQAQLAEKSGVSRKQISDYEMGLQSSPRTRTLEKLAEALDISVFNLKPDAEIPSELDESVKRSLDGHDEPNIVSIDIDTSEFPEEFFDEIEAQAKKNGRTFDEQFHLFVFRLLTEDMNNHKSKELSGNPKHVDAEVAFKKNSLNSNTK